MKDWLKVWDDVLPGGQCAELRAFIDEAGRRIDTDYRRCDVATIAPGARVYPGVAAAMRRALDRYKSLVAHYENLHHVTHLEAPLGLKYVPETGDRFAMHVDNWNAASALRQLSVIVYLNAPPGGGHTEFPLQGQAVWPKEGRLVIFPSHITFPHVAHPPSGGPKYALVAWLTFAPTGEATYPAAPLPSASPEARP